MNNRIKEIRTCLGLTLEEFGKKIGFTRSSLSNIETGYRNVTDRLVLAICNAYNVNEEWLRTGKGEMFNATTNSFLNDIATEYNLDDLDLKIIQNYLLLDKEKRAVIKEYIQSLSDTVSDKEKKGDPTELTKEKIDEEVESYRKELEAELKGAEKLSALDDTKDNIKKTN